MFILTYLTIFVILFCDKTFGLYNFNEGDDSDAGWGLFLSVSQGNNEYPSYDIGHWTKQLHLQQCAFVEIGEEFCALFVELRSIPSTEKFPESSGVSEFFLGLCECATVRSWILCSNQLMRRRKADCIFTEALPSANTSARVHRRLCDVTLLTKYAEPCNCSVPMANQQLYRTKGFPTCFRTPLPESICSPRGVCGVAECCATTIRGIHSPQCNPDCHERQPFCEELGPWTSIPPQITSLWSHWSAPVCVNNDGRIFSTATAICHNQVTGQPAIDCIGPGSFCCPIDAEKCTCIVTNKNGILKAIRMVESTLCILDGARILRNATAKRRDVSSHVYKYKDPNHLYPNTLEENMNHQSDSEFEDSVSPFRRRLMFSNYDDSQNRDHSFGRSVEFARSNRVAINDEIDDSNEDEDNDDEDEDEEDDGDMGLDEDGEIAENDENDEENTDSSEFYNYVRRVRDPNMKRNGLRWMNERSSRFVRSEPSLCIVHRKRKESPQFGGNGEEECEEPEGGSGLDGPLQYADYDAGETLNNRGKGSVDNDENVMSLAVIGRPAKSHLFYHLLTYICIALST